MRAARRMLSCSRMRCFFLAFAALALAGCADVHCMSTFGYAQSPDLESAMRVSAARDLPCSAASIATYRIEHRTQQYSHSGHSREYYDVAEGCGERVVYLERCGREPLIPGGLTEEQASASARRRSTTIAC
jgi:hypothetical protein